MGEKIPQESETIAARRAARIAEKIKQTRETFATRRAWWSNILFEALILLGILSLNIYLASPFLGISTSGSFYSGPVIPLIARLFESFGFTLSRSLHIVNIVFFILFPFSLYFFVYKISKRKLIAIFAVLFASLPFYPFALVRASNGLMGLDSAHISSLTIVPLARQDFILF